MTSHFSFFRGEKEFEVFVAKKWTTNNISDVKRTKKNATPLFLEEDDFAYGHEAFALDFFLMKKTGTHISGEKILPKIRISTKKMKHNLEGEVRRLATKLRTSYFHKEMIPMKPILVTLDGIAEGLKELGKRAPLPKKIREELGKPKNIFFPRNRSNTLLELLQKWENFLEKK